MWLGWWDVPLFVILLGLRFLPHEPLSPRRVTGIAVGLVGVALLAGGHPEGGWWAVAGTLAVVVSSLAYASGNVVGQRSVGTTAGPVLASAVRPDAISCRVFHDSIAATTGSISRSRAAC